MKKNILSVALLAMLSTPALAQQNPDIQNPDIMVVFDASGSMWGQIDGRTKIEIARDAFSNLSANWSATGTNVGLIAYGHRRKGDCGDIELISLPKAGSTARLGELVQKLTPRGKTPLSDAVSMAAKELRFTENAATVILLSDGRETCGVDVCAAGAELERLGVNFTAHVIGFDVNDKEARTQLQCLAGNTGGKYFDAKDADELSAALASVASYQAPATVTQTAVQMVDLSVGIRETDGTYRPPEVTLKATNLNTDETIIMGTLTDAKQVVNGWQGSLPEGEWKIELISTEGYGSIDVLLSGQRAELEIPFAAFQLDFTLEDNGPYLLGVEQIMLLTPTAAIQKNAQLRVAMYPEGASDISQRMDFSYRFGAIAGQLLEHWFESPTISGNYDIIVMRGNDLNDIIFKQTVSYEANVTPTWLGLRQGEAGALLPVRIGGMNNPFATLVLSKDGRKIWDDWFQNIVTDDGVFMPLPSEEGIYDLSLKYKDGQGERVEFELGTINVGSVVLEDDADAVAPPSEASSTQGSQNATPTWVRQGYWVLNQRFTGERITTVEVAAEAFDNYLPFENPTSTPMGRGDALKMQSITLLDGNLSIKYQTEFGLAEGVLALVNDGFEGTIASAKGEIFVPVRLEYLSDIGLSAKDHGAEPQDSSEYAYLCDEVFCNQIALEFDLSWALPNGWGATAPFYYTTAGGAQASLPTMEFIALQSGADPFMAVLNPLQWIEANGPCYEVTRGELCRFEGLNASDEPAFLTLLSSLREVPLSKTPLSANDIESIFLKIQKQ